MRPVESLLRRTNRWENRQIIKKNYGPMEEICLIPDEEPCEGSFGELWWYREFQGKDYGGYIRIGNSPEEGLDVFIDFLYQSAVLTMDNLADEELHVKDLTPDDITNLINEGDDTTLIKISNYLSSKDSVPLSDDMEHDSYWLDRAKKRKELLEVLGIGEKD